MDKPEDGHSRPVALVTGAAGGIGRETTLRLVSMGLSVVALDRAGEGLKVLASAQPDRIFPCPFDLKRTRAITGMVAGQIRRHGTITVLVNNAGTWFSERLVDIQDRNWDLTMRVNVTAPMALMRAVVPGMIHAGGGCIVNVSSRNAFVSSVENTAYDASKAALIAMTRTTAGELAGYRIRVNAVCPGVIDTAPNRDLIRNPRLNRTYRRLIPMDRYGRPEEIAGVIAFLTTDDASFITGQSIVADGGQMACQDWKRVFGVKGAKTAGPRRKGVARERRGGSP